MKLTLVELEVVKKVLNEYVKEYEILIAMNKAEKWWLWNGVEKSAELHDYIVSINTLYKVLANENHKVKGESHNLVW